VGHFHALRILRTCKARRRDGRLGIYSKIEPDDRRREKLGLDEVERIRV
jgi:hypothetical protein